MSEPPPAAQRKYVQRQLEGAAREFYDRLSAGVLATTGCERCELTRFPPRLRCGRCGAETTWVELPREGRLHAFTTQESALRFGAPAVLALVELGPAILPAICDTPYPELQIGQSVTAEAQVESDTGLPVLHLRPVAAYG